MTDMSKHRSNAGWAVLLQFSRFGSNALLFLVMARFLSLAEIGAFGVAYAPIRLLQVFYRTGIAETAVVVDQSAERGALTCLFWLAIGGTCLVVPTLAGLAIAFASDPVHDMMLALLAVPILLAVASVPEGLLRRDLRIRALALRTLGVQGASALVALALALGGAGGWSLVGFTLLNAALGTVTTLRLARWRPRGRPNVASLRPVWPTVASLTGRALVANAILPLLQLATGAALGLPAAGTFQIAQRVYQILDAVSLAPIRYLVLPIFARASANGSSPVEPASLRRTLGLAALIAAPVYVGALVLAGPVLTFILGSDTAGPSVITFQILTLAGFNLVIVTILTQAFVAAGRAPVTLVRTLINLCVTAVLAFPALMISTEAVAAAFVVGSYAAMAVFLRLIRRGSEVAPREVLGWSGGPFLIAGLAALPLIAAGTLLPVWTLVVLIPLSISVYLVLIWRLLPDLATDAARLIGLRRFRE